ncbi:MAG: ribose-phosphate pyrophosphokinase [Clostridia bacterium]|nr:ribose-phosphate pyrophosphokinase [Clostridia bacterium]
MNENSKAESSQKFPTRPVAPLGVIAMRGCEEIGNKVNEYLLRWQVSSEGETETSQENLHSFYGSDRNGFLLEAECPRFGTGEAKGMLKGSVRGYDLFIICDVGAYQCTYKLYGREVPMSPDEHYADLKRIIAAVSGKAYRINVIMPMLYEARQHRRTARESLDCALMLQELVNMGVANIITFDAHDPRVSNSIPLHGFESIMPTYQMLKAMCKTYSDLSFDSDHMMVVSPDEGALGRNIYYSSALGVDMGMFYKRRDYTRVVNGTNPIVAHEYLGASVEGKDIFVADDIIASGDSILDLAYNLKSRGARRVFAGATFAFFTKGAEIFDKAYAEGAIDHVFATNLTYTPQEILDRPWFTRAEMSKYMAYVIATLNHDQSLSYLLNPWHRIEKLLTRYRASQQG